MPILFRSLAPLLPGLLLLPYLPAEEPAKPIPRPHLEKYDLPPAPAPQGLQLKQGDRLAICGDSITEQKMYSVIIDTYLTACMPALGVTCRQYGWSGEKADGFAARMQQDVLRFQPTIATTCYGMNDHRYVPFTDEIGETYRTNQTKVAQTFRDAGVRLIIGSSGTIGSVPHWVKTASGTWEDLNLSLNRLRNIALDVATTEKTGFADIFSLMLHGMGETLDTYGNDFLISGKDGVHPGWAGQTYMAFAFLKAMGLDGDLGTLSVDLSRGKATGENGHKAVSFENGALTVESTRYPFCPPAGDATNDSSMQSAIAMLPFHQELNRLTLRVTGGDAKTYDITWGASTKTYPAEELEKGVNLAADFPDNPLRPAFEGVWKAVTKRQEYETYQIKKAFRSPDAKKDMEKIVESTEKERAPLAAAVAEAVKPVTHTITIKPGS